MRSQTFFQDDTPVPSVLETATLTPTFEVSMTPTGVIESTPTLVVETPTATLEATTPSPTLAVSETTTQASTLLTADQPSGLSFKLSAMPEQAGPGDEVTYTIEVMNNGEAPVSGLLFSNILPEDFSDVQDGFKNFDFEPNTRLLTWNGVKAGVPTLAPGQKLTLAYTVQVDSTHDEVQLIDSATLNAGGLLQPLQAEAVLTLLVAQKHLTMLDSKGGVALGLNNRIEINLPKDAIKESSGVLVQDLNDGLSPAKDQPWLKFALEMRVAEPKNAQKLQEQDKIIPLEPIESKFDQPVELTVSFDGLADLSTLEADKTPFLVTLDEASGTALGLDVIAGGVSLLEGLVAADAYILAGGACIASEFVGCAPAFGLAFQADMAATAIFALPENGLGMLSLGITAANDYLHGNMGIDPDIGPYLGKDTVVSGRNALAGFIPESFIDLGVSLSQLKYDMDRATGNKSGGYVPVFDANSGWKTPPLQGDFLQQTFLKDWW